MNKNNLLTQLLKEIKKGHTPTHEDYKMSHEDFGDIVECALTDGYIKNVTILRGGRGNKVMDTDMHDVQLTACGVDYLNKVSDSMYI